MKSVTVAGSPFFFKKKKRYSRKNDTELAKVCAEMQQADF
jgi:hypothetical protein